MKKAAIVAVCMAAAMGLSACQKNEGGATSTPAETSTPTEMSTSMETSTPAESSTPAEMPTEAEAKIKVINFDELKTRRDKGMLEYYDNNYVYSDTVNYTEDGHIFLEGSIKNIGTTEKKNIIVAHYARNDVKTKLRSAGATYIETLAPGETKEFKVDVTELTKGDDGQAAKKIAFRNLFIESDQKLAEDTDWETVKTTMDWKEAMKDDEQVPAVKTFDSEAMIMGDKAMRKFYRENYFYEQMLGGDNHNPDVVLVKGVLQNMTQAPKKNVTLTHYAMTESGEYVEIGKTHFDEMKPKEIKNFAEDVTAAVTEKMGGNVSPMTQLKIVVTEE